MHATTTFLAITRGLLIAAALTRAGVASGADVLVLEVADDDARESLRARSDLIRAVGRIPGISIAPISRLKKLARAKHLDLLDLGDTRAVEELSRKAHLTAILSSTVDERNGRRVLHLTARGPTGALVYHRNLDLAVGELLPEDAESITDDLAAALGVRTSEPPRRVVRGHAPAAEPQSLAPEQAVAPGLAVAPDPVLALSPSPAAPHRAVAPDPVLALSPSPVAADRAVAPDPVLALSPSPVAPHRAVAPDRAVEPDPVLALSPSPVAPHRAVAPDPVLALSPPPVAPDPVLALPVPHPRGFQEPLFQLELGALGSTMTTSLADASHLGGDLYPGVAARIQAFPFQRGGDWVAGAGVIADASFALLKLAGPTPAATARDLRLDADAVYRRRLGFLREALGIYSPSIGLRAGAQLRDFDVPAAASLHPLDRLGARLGAEVLEPLGRQFRLVLGGSLALSPTPGAEIERALQIRQTVSDGFEFSLELQARLGASGFTGALRAAYGEFDDCFELAGSHGCNLSGKQASAVVALLIGYALY